MKRTCVLLVMVCALGLTTANAATTTFTQGIDLWLTSSDNPDTGNPNLGFGRGSTSNYDSLLRFTSMFGSGPGQIPLGSTINSATLYMWVNDIVGHNSAIYPMTVDWTAASTWSSIGGGVLPGTNAAASPAYAWTGTIDPLTLRTFDLTASVQDWSNGQGNYGWGFTGDRSGAVIAQSLDYSVEDERPYLLVDYTAPTPVIPVPASVLLVGVGLGFCRRFARRRRA